MCLGSNIDDNVLWIYIILQYIWLFIYLFKSQDKIWQWLKILPHFHKGVQFLWGNVCINASYHSSCHNFPNSLSDVINFYKSNKVDLIETHPKPSYYFILKNWILTLFRKGLSKASPSRKFSSTPKISQFIMNLKVVVIVFRSKPPSFT